MRCPAENFTNYWKGQNSTSYGWNTQSHGMGVSDYYSFSPPISKSLSEACRRIQTTEIAHPASTFMIGEHITADRMFDYSNSQFHIPAKDGDPGFATYHQGASNALWADGHASTITKADLTPENFSRNK
jgi:prepilin-type processing-associated H-X9-DG protein